VTDWNRWLEWGLVAVAVIGAAVVGYLHAEASMAAKVQINRAHSIK
jgi:hypothetical protein